MYKLKRMAFDALEIKTTNRLQVIIAIKFLYL